MKVRMPYFPIGSSYYPPFHHPDEWERDLANMKRAGLTMIRTAELLASWDYIEPRRGEPEWDWLDHLFALSQAHDIQIVLGTGSCNPPIWMVELYPDLQRIAREGVPYPTNTQWGWACVNHPGLRSELQRYLNLLLERYSDSPTLYCWQIDNQIGHATPYTGAERAQPRRYGYYCYCHHCTHKFRAWLKAKYGDINTLNHAWSWDPTHHRYYAWHQIMPPRSMPAEWGNGTAWLDFRRFVHDSFTDYIKYQHDLIKAYDPKQLTMHNLYDCLRPDLGARKEPNHWDIGAVPDIIGHDIYPSENSFRKDPPHSSWFLDFAYSVAHHNDRTMWIPELESGPLGGFSAGPNLSTTAQDIKRFNLACIGHGAKSMLYQGYRDWNCIPLHWGGLVDFHGELTDRFHAAAEVIRVVKEHEDFFLDAVPPQAQVALYHSFDNVIIIDGQANERFLYAALRGVHTALWRKGYTIQFIEPRFIGKPSTRYKVIVLPFVMHLPKQNAEKLTHFVEEGGTVIGFAKLGHLDDKGWAWNDRPGAGLTGLFGARETKLEVFREPDDALKIKVEPAEPLFENIANETILGYWHRQTFSLTDDVAILARFVDGAPAIIRRQHGTGQAILVATHLDIAVWEHKDPAAIQLLANLMTLCGVKKDILVQGDDVTYVENHIDAHLLELGAQRAVIINNEGAEEASITVTVPASHAATTAIELFSGKHLTLAQDRGTHFTLHLAPTHGAIVMIH
jgi:beta-galactosidase GanA